MRHLLTGSTTQPIVLCITISEPEKYHVMPFLIGFQIDDRKSMIESFLSAIARFVAQVMDFD
jgi:hypothetical protein